MALKKTTALKNSPADEVHAMAGRAHYAPEVFSEYVGRCRLLLQRLADVHPLFRSLLILSRSTRTTSSGYDIARPLAHDFGEQVRAACFDSNDLDSYWDLSADHGLTDYSKSAIGFRTSFYSACADGEKIPLSAGGFRLDLVGPPITAGGRASAALQIGITEDASMPWTYVKIAWTTMLETWSADHGFVYRRSIQEHFKKRFGASSAGMWFLYVRDERLTDCMPTHVTRERFGSGVILSTTPHLPDPGNSADLNAAEKMSAALEEFGLLRHSYYVATGWPADPRQDAYTHYITGAPSDRKYVVHCVDFDGWDPDRRVLLYAKLFGQLKETPKQWGLRGLDEPVINEAQRQVRAAAKAGGVPIEWHIGLEEPARRARYLIEQHTNIKEHQLKVVYNPMPASLVNQGDTQQ